MAHRLVFVGRSSREFLRRYRSRLRQLRDEGFEVLLFAGDDCDQQEWTKEGIVFQALPVKNPHNAAGLLGAYFILQGAFLEEPPLLVHVFGHRLSWLVALAAKQAEVKALITTMEYHWVEERPVHLPKIPYFGKSLLPKVGGVESYLNRVIGPLFRQTMEERYRWLGEQVDRYIVTNRFDERLVRDLDLVDEDKLQLLSGGPGVIAQRARDVESRKESRDLLGLQKSWRILFGWTGELVGRHGGEALLSLIASVSRSNPEVGWVIGTKGRRWSTLWSRLKSFEARGIVKIIDEPTLGQEDLLYKSLDALIWLGSPSTPLDPVLEAGAFGVPTVGYESPAAREVLRQNETGLLVLEEDLDALTKSVQSLLLEPGKLKNLSERVSRDLALRFARYDRDEQVLKLYAELLREKLGAGPITTL